jgi:hypothetical protein
VRFVDPVTDLRGRRMGSFRSADVRGERTVAQMIASYRAGLIVPSKINLMNGKYHLVNIYLFI